MTGSLKDLIEMAAVDHNYPDGKPYRSLPVSAVDRIAQECSVPKKEIEITALETEILPERYARNMRSLSYGQQAALLQAQVAVVGMGGLGGGVCEMLARVGVGKLILIDGDRFEDSNLNRQLFSSEAALGCAKAKTAAERIAAVNSSIETVVHTDFISSNNTSELIAGVGLAVDCLDTIGARRVLAAACKHLAIPLVCAAVAGTAGHVTTIYPGDDSLDQLYGAPSDSPDRGAETTLGNLAATVSLTAALECAEVLKILLRQPNLLRKRLLVFDLSDYAFDVLDLEPPADPALHT